MAAIIADITKERLPLNAHLIYTLEEAAAYAEDRKAELTADAAAAGEEVRTLICRCNNEAGETCNYILITQPDGSTTVDVQIAT